MIFDKSTFDTIFSGTKKPKPVIFDLNIALQFNQNCHFVGIFCLVYDLKIYLKKKLWQKEKLTFQLKIYSP